MANLLYASQITYLRGSHRILNDVTIGMDAGEVVALLGVNGAGKSTLLRIMLGLLKPVSGEVRLNGKSLASYSRREIASAVAYVPQAHVATFPYAVRQIVAMGRIPHTGLGRGLSEADHLVVQSVMDRLSITGLAERPYTELSGGERQRVLLARALAQQAKALVMDEPLTGLDLGHQMRMLQLLKELAAEGYAILHTTHRPEDAFAIANRVALLSEGRLIADGDPHLVLSGAAVSNLYDISVEQRDLGKYRIFVPAE